MPRSDDPPEPELIAAARRGGPAGQAAFGILVVQHQVWLVRYLFYILGDMGEADDVAQEVLLKAYAALSGLRDADRFRGWLRSIATRQAFNRRRDAATRRRYEGQAEPSMLLPGPEGLLAVRESLLAAMAGLAYPYREILILRHVEELSLQEIAATIDISLSAAKMRLTRARQAFMERYEGVTR